MSQRLGSHLVRRHYVRLPMSRLINRVNIGNVRSLKLLAAPSDIPVCDQLSIE